MRILKNILLIGGSGFIGSELTKMLSSDKNLNITVVHVGDAIDEVSGVDYKQIDLSQGGPEAAALVKSADVTVLMAQPNEALIKVFLRLAQESDLQKIVYTSTMLLYPNSAEPQSESASLEPLNDYETKKFNEEQLLQKFASSKTKICITRLGNVYGNKKNKGIVNLIIRALVSGQTLTINGDGEHVRDYIFVVDVADALKQIIFLQSEENLEIYNICSGQGHTINEVISQLEKITGKKVNKKNGPPVLEKRSIVGDNTKIRNRLNFQVKLDLKSGLTATCKNYSLN